MLEEKLNPGSYIRQIRDNFFSLRKELLRKASKKDNLITTATVFCLLGKTWPNALKDANNVFETSFIKSIHLKKKKKKKAFWNA